ncbi:MAG: hypothetical protein M3Y56_08005, partial [Armatimonadota bacterium]|nr:hypothetical protein [Armatimonadota bacterium]
AEQGGLGGHQWAHASTSNFITWDHHPLALPIGPPGSVDQHGICTGSIFEHEDVYNAFYATRIRNGDGSVSEVVCRATSRDLIHFDKSPTNPLFPAPPSYDRGNHRDPFVFRHPQTGMFHMLVTASREGRGVLAHYTSPDLEVWTLEEPFLTGRDHHTPECPELFEWNGWWYLIYGHNAQLEYRMARDPLGPWQEAPFGTIEGAILRVPRTAAFTGGRRLAAGFLAWREHGRDEGDYVYAGSAVFRELLQGADGTLRTCFVPEMLPQTGPALSVQSPVVLNAGEDMRTMRIMDAPADCILSIRLTATGNAGEFGLILRSDERLETGYRLLFHPRNGRMSLRSWPDGGGQLQAGIDGIEGLDRGVNVMICMKDSIIDICVNGQQTAVERCFNDRGTTLGVFTRAGAVRVEGLLVASLGS